MKRFIYLFLALLMVCVCIPFTFSAQAADSVVFVMTGGQGTKDGSSPENALGSLNTAFNTISPTGGTIVMIGQMIAPNNCFFAKSVTTRKDVVLTSVYNGVDYRASNSAALVLDANAEFFNPRVTMENFNIIVRKDSLALYAVGIELILKETCNVTLDGTTKMLSLSTKTTTDGLKEAGTFAEYQSGKINTINKGGVVGITFDDPSPAATTAAETTAASTTAAQSTAVEIPKPETTALAENTDSPATLDVMIALLLFAGVATAAIILIKKRAPR